MPELGPPGSVRGGAARRIPTAMKAIRSLRRTLRLSSTFPASFTPWSWKTDLAVSRPIMLQQTAGRLGHPEGGAACP